MGLSFVKKKRMQPPFLPHPPPTTALWKSGFREHTVHLALQLLCSVSLWYTSISLTETNERKCRERKWVQAISWIGFQWPFVLIPFVCSEIAILKLNLLGRSRLSFRFVLWCLSSFCWVTRFRFSWSFCHFREGSLLCLGMSILSLAALSICHSSVSPQMSLFSVYELQPHLDWWLKRRFLVAALQLFLHKTVEYY